MVGGGPAGLECARVAAERGHRVTLAEASGELGGQFRLAGLQPRRAQILDLMDWYQRQLEKLQVTVQYNTPLEAEEIEATDADVVVLATGSLPAGTGFQKWRPELDELPGIARAGVWSVEEVMARAARLGEKVIVLDEAGNWRGCGTAWHIAEQGHRVTLVTPDPMVGKELARTAADFPLRQRLTKLGARFHLESVIGEWHGDGATLVSLLDGSEQRLEADSLVLATTNLAETSLQEGLAGGGPGGPRDRRLRRAADGALRLLRRAQAGAQLVNERAPVKRVPAEWEPQAAIWLQWPGRWERAYEPAFAKISAVIAGYETLHIIHGSSKIRQDARAAISRHGGDPDHPNIVWHAVPNDSAWMRDNGPVYVVDGDELRIQSWGFDAWGGAFGADVPYAHDNEVPSAVGAYLNLPVDKIDIVHERGNLEFNGVDTVILNWSVLGDPRRNPDYTKQRAEADLKAHFGVTKVVFVEGVPEGDLTNGHIDGIARFIDPATVVVPDCTAGSKCRPGNGDDVVYDRAAATIEAAGFTVLRDPIEGSVTYRGESYDTNYMNWLVGNGFVIAVGFGDPAADAAAKARLEGYFPERDVYVIEMLGSWAAGGGVHCHTNDQPEVPL